MTTAKHTPGPWETGTKSGIRVCIPPSVRERWMPIVWASGGRDVAYIVPGHDTSEADAHLIAAAPDLLEALEALVAEQNGPPLLGRHERAWREAMAKAKAVIAKAKEGRDIKRGRAET